MNVRPKLLFASLVLLMFAYSITTTLPKEVTQEKQSVDSKPEADDQSVNTKHTDLDGGLELIETTHFSEGKVGARLKTFKRHGVVIMEYTYHPELGMGGRKYYLNGKPIMFEGFNNDGRIQELIVLGTDGSLAEVFKRKEDGTTTPLSSEELEEVKKGTTFIENTFRPIADAVQKGDQELAKEKIDEAIEKVKSIKD